MSCVSLLIIHAINMTTRITVKNEVGRPVNPNEKWEGVYEHGRYVANRITDEWTSFEKSIKEHEAPGIPDTKEGEFVEAELVKQWQRGNGDWEFIYGNQNVSINPYCNTRMVYRLPQQPKEQEKEKTAIETLAQFTGSDIHYLHDKNRLIMAMESYASQQTTTLQATLNDQCAAYDKLVEELDNRVVAKDTRISELEARVKELEGALQKLANATTNWPYGHSIPEMAKIATNALKVNTLKGEK